MNTKPASTVILVLMTFFVRAQTTTAPPAEFKPTISFKALIQPRFESALTDSVDVASGKVSPTPVTNNFRLRRAEIRADLKLNDHWSGTIRIQFPELKVAANSVTSGRALELAYFQYDLNEKFGMRGGQMKMPYELDDLTDHSDLRMIDRGTTNQLFNNNSLVSYQPGFMVYGTFLKSSTPLNYYAGIFNSGNRAVNFDVNSGKNLVGRLEYYPLKSLRLGVNAQYVAVQSDNNGVSAGGDVSFIRDLNRHLNLTVEGEYIAAPDVNLFTADTSKTKELSNFTMNGYFGQALLKIRTNFKAFQVFEVGGKYENTDPRTQLSDNSSLAFHTITGDIGFDFLPNNQARLQLNVIRTIYAHPASTSKNNTFFVMQMQVKIG
jgi:Phosphate-selective porin O and P